MKLLLFLFVPLILCLERVNDYTFDKIVKKSGDYVLVDFYADWCRHCKQLMPTIEKLSDLYQPVSGINIVKHNAGERSGRKMVKKYEIDGYPMLVLFHGDDKPIFYEGSRDFESINNFIKLATGNTEIANPKIVPVYGKTEKKILHINDNNIEPLVLNTQKKTLMMVGGHWCRHCKQLTPKIEQIHDIYANDDDIQVALVMLDPENGTTNKLRTQFGVDNIPAILWFDPTKVNKNNMKAPELYEGKRNVADLLSFINNKGFHRQENGRLTSDVGKLNIDVSKVFSKDVNDVVISVLDQIDNSNADDRIKNYYKRIIDKGPMFIQREITRLTLMVTNDSENLSSDDLDFMDIRLNILRHFHI